MKSISSLLYVLPVRVYLMLLQCVNVMEVSAMGTTPVPGVNQ